MKYALVYGLISGTVIILTMIAGFELTEPDSVTHSLWFGYLLMLVVLTLIFVGVKRYRDIECGGVIRFGRAFLTGLGMAAFASLAYVLIFEVYLAATEYRFFEDYIAGTMQNRAAAGASAAEVASERANLESMLRNPLVRVPMVFLEIFPVGLVVALVSALLLRNPKVLPATHAA